MIKKVVPRLLKRVLQSGQLGMAQKYGSVSVIDESATRGSPTVDATTVKAVDCKVHRQAEDSAVNGKAHLKSPEQTCVSGTVVYYTGAMVTFAKLLNNRHKRGIYDRL